MQFLNSVCHQKLYTVLIHLGSNDLVTEDIGSNIKEITIQHSYQVLSYIGPHYFHIYIAMLHQ